MYKLEELFNAGIIHSAKVIKYLSGGWGVIINDEYWGENTHNREHAIDNAIRNMKEKLEKQCAKG